MPRVEVNLKIPATQKQIEYVEQLMIDLQIYDTSAKRRAYMREIVGREVAPADLYKHEASAVIDKLKEWKENGIKRTATETEP